MIRNNRRALELDPLLYVIHFNLGLYYYFAEDFEEAYKQMKEYEQYQPGSIVFSSFTSMVLLELGRTEEAKKEVEKEFDPFWKSYAKIKVLFQAGEKNKATKMLSEFIELYPEETVNIADIYAFIGDREKTFQWLQKALEIQDPTLTEAVYYPTFKKFHDDPRWQQLLEDMGVPEENGIPGYRG